MTASDLTAVATSTLRRLLDAVRGEQLRTPLTTTDLVAFGVREQLDSLVAVLQGHPRAACISVLEVALAERVRADRPVPELVWTGPDTEHGTTRDTAVVLQELFEGARKRVVLAGYSFLNTDRVLAPLHQAMVAHGVAAHLFIHVRQVEASVVPDAYAQDELSAFIDRHWPFGQPFPALYCDRRALDAGPPYASLHAKCVAVDGERALVSSANFTERGQERNIETGVLLHDRRFAEHLERQWMRLVETGLVVRWMRP